MFIPLPTKWTENPDHYLSKADHIQTDFLKGLHHEGLYMGLTGWFKITRHL